LAVGINWIDTAATYGDGRSEAHLGAALADCGVSDGVHLATKVRLPADRLDDIGAYVAQSVADSLRRLGRGRVTLVQLHNAITDVRGSQPTSVSPDDVLGPDGVLAAFNRLKAQGVTEHIGLTGIGDVAALRAVIATGEFDTIQIPYHVLNPSAGRAMPAGFAEADYGNLIADCAAREMGVLAIRVYAAGALLGNAPSAHTQQTVFFPLDLYRRDVARAQALAGQLPRDLPMQELALRWVLGDARVSSALLGFGEVAHVDAAVAAAERGPLSEEILRAIDAIHDSPPASQRDEASRE
ncbi:MAG: aldo/keto reductase, partial [Gemmatimonadetes bacterium]|nr:aldo/keto reductase [Gemmatimonadota bacterium]